MTRPITPGHADGINHAVTARMDRITRTTPAAIKALHDSQPGFPSGGDGGRSGGGHSDPTARIALEGDPVKDTLEEVTRLFCDLDRITDRLATLMPNWANDNQRWEEARRTEAAAKLNDDHNWCQAHMRAGIMEPARTKGSRLCRRCELDRTDLDGDPPVWLIEKRHRGQRISTIDMANAKREVRTTGKAKKGKR